MTTVGTISEARPPRKDVKESAAAVPPSSSSSKKISSTIRRRLTMILINADVFTSNDIVEALDDSEQQEVQLEFENLCREVIQAFEGTVVQSTDTGLLGCFGYPLACV